MLALTACAPTARAARVSPTPPLEAPRPPGAEWEGRAWEFRKVRDGVWLAVGTGALGVGSTAAVKRLDLRAHVANYPALADPAQPDVAERLTQAVRRIYELLEAPSRAG